MKTNQLISTLMEDMQSTICRVAALEDNMASSSSSSRVPQVAKTPRSKDVPLAVRVSTFCKACLGACDLLVNSTK